MCYGSPEDEMETYGAGLRMRGGGGLVSFLKSSTFESPQLTGMEYLITELDIDHYTLWHI
jgi:hypothetical protein